MLDVREFFQYWDGLQIKKELKYAYTGVLEDNFQSSVREALSEANRSDGLEEDDDDDFFDNDGDDDDDNEEGNHNSNIRDTDIEKWVNINDLELKKLLNIEVNVVIESPPLHVIDHSSNVFNVEATVDKILGS